MEFLNRFDNVNTLADVYLVARELRAEGVDPIVINSLITTVKKRLIARGNGVKRLNRIPIPTEEASTTQVTQFFVQIQHFHRPLIIVNQDGTILI